MSKILRVYDRSRTTTDWKCPRMRYWGYEFQGKGITSNRQGLELFLGTVLHDGLAAIAGGVPIKDVADAARVQVREGLLPQVEMEPDGPTFAEEQATLIQGLLLGFYKQVWPRLLIAFPQILWVEEEMTFHHDNLTFMSRPDLVMANEKGDIFYIEYKSTSSKREGWVNSWNTAVQLHSTIKAIEETKGVSVTGVIVQGLYKGYESYGKQNSPFCYCYRREGSPPFSTTQIVYEYKSGFKRYPSWELEGGVEKWVEEMPEQILQDQFPQTPPIFVNEELVERFFSQRGVREREIQMALEMLSGEDEETDKAILDTAFPQRFDQCVPSFGHPCGFRPLCHGQSGGFGGGIHAPHDGDSEESRQLPQGFVWREPHHQLELDQSRNPSEG